MYTGIIEAVGELSRLERRGAGAFVFVHTPDEFKCAERVKIGDSVASNGTCLTATAVQADGFYADVSAETMALTCFKFYAPGTLLNLELPCTPFTHLGGHIVQGHVDGIGTVRSLSRLSEAIDIWVEMPAALRRYVAYKGSIAVDGMSLTVNEVSADAFRLTVIPHTQEVTNIKTWRPGSRVNLEADVLARYVERLLDPSLRTDGSSGGADRPALSDHTQSSTGSQSSRGSSGSSKAGAGLTLESLLAAGFR